MNRDNVTHDENAIRIYKLDQGRVHLIKTLNDHLICPQKTDKSSYFFEEPLDTIYYQLRPVEQNLDLCYWIFRVTRF